MIIIIKDNDKRTYIRSPSPPIPLAVASAGVLLSISWMLSDVVERAGSHGRSNRRVDSPHRVQTLGKTEALTMQKTKIHKNVKSSSKYVIIII